MDTLLNNLEKRFGKWSITDLTKKLVILKVIIFIMVQVLFQGNPQAYINTLQGMSFGKIHLLGDLLASLCTPPVMSINGLNIIFLYFALMIFLMAGRAIEASWGTFKFNLFILSYALIYILVLTSFRFFVPDIPPIPVDYLYMSLFLTFAMLFPNVEFLIFFVLPVKVKFLAWIAGLFMAYSVFQSPELFGKAFNAIPLVHYAIVALPFTLKRKHHQKRARAFQKEIDPVQRQGFFHQCSECGINDQKDPDMEFRVGDDGKDYCIKHIK
jgi:hypothetical protein